EATQKGKVAKDSKQDKSKEGGAMGVERRSLRLQVQEEAKEQVGNGEVGEKRKKEDKENSARSPIVLG
ncbi:hypothetical protein T484DRAFT_1818720, partial [Baffinella frigidus]